MNNSHSLVRRRIDLGIIAGPYVYLGPWSPTVHGYLVYKKPHPPQTLQQDSAYGSTAVLGGGRFLL